LFPCRSNGKVLHDTERLELFLQQLIRHGYDLHVVHTNCAATSLPAAHHGDVSVTHHKRVLMRREDAQHTRHLHRLEALTQEMVQIVDDAFHNRINIGETKGSAHFSYPLIIYTHLVINVMPCVCLVDAESKGETKHDYFVLDTTAPTTALDTEDNIMRCGRQGAPLLTVIIGPYM
jgi:hypothetical protein